MTNENKGDCVYIPLCERSVSVEISNDFTLPDYQQEIRRVLCIEAEPQPPSSYAGDSSAEFNGTVEIRLTYISADGTLCTAPLTTDYSFSVPYECDTQGGDVTALCSVYVDSATARVSAPRRLNMRLRLRPAVRVYSAVPLMLDIDGGEDGEGIFKRQESCQLAECHSGTSDIIEVTYICPSLKEDQRVVSADTEVRVDSWEHRDGAICCRGSVKVTLLCSSDTEGELTSVSGDATFEGEIDAECMSDEQLCRVWGTAAHSTVTVTEIGAECNIGVLLFARWLCRNETEFVSDLYSTERESECEIRSYITRAPLFCKNINFTVNERIPLESMGIPHSARAVRCFGSARMDSCSVNGSRPVLSGDMNLTVIYTHNGEFLVAETVIPVKYECDTSVSCAPVVLDAFARASDFKMRIADGDLLISAEMTGYAEGMSEVSVSAVESVSLGEVLPKRSGELIVCYVSSDDTQWSLSKRYRVSPGDILGDTEKDPFVMIG